MCLFALFRSALFSLEVSLGWAGLTCPNIQSASLSGPRQQRRRQIEERLPLGHHLSTYLPGTVSGLDVVKSGFQVAHTHTTSLLLLGAATATAAPPFCLKIRTPPSYRLSLFSSTTAR